MKTSHWLDYLIVISLIPWPADAQCSRCGDISRASALMNESLNQYSLTPQYTADIANDYVNDESKKGHLKIATQEITKLGDLLSVDYQPGQTGAFLMMFRLPNDFKINAKPQDSLSVNFGASNTFIRPQTLYENNARPLQLYDFFANKDPLKDRKKTSYSLDAVGQQWSLKRTKPLDSETEFGMSLRFFNISGGDSLILYPVSDKFIEKFHSQIGQEDPFGRKREGMNLVAIDMTDFNGNRIKTNEAKTYVLPIVFDLNKFKTLYESDTAKTTLKYGGHVGVPLDKDFGQLGIGTDCVVTHNQMVSENYMVSAAVGIALQLQKNVLGGYQPTPGIDKSHHESLTLALTRLDSDRQGKTSIVANYSQNSAFLNGNYDSVIGPKSPVYSGRVVDQMSADVMTRRDRSIELAVVRESKKWTFSGGFQEDLSANPNIKTINGANSRDFTYFISAKRKF